MYRSVVGAVVVVALLAGCGSGGTLTFQNVAKTPGSSSSPANPQESDASVRGGVPGVLAAPFRLAAADGLISQAATDIFRFDVPAGTSELRILAEPESGDPIRLRVASGTPADVTDPAAYAFTDPVSGGSTRAAVTITTSTSPTIDEVLQAGHVTIAVTNESTSTFRDDFAVGMVYVFALPGSASSTDTFGASGTTLELKEEPGGSFAVTIAGASLTAGDVDVFSFSLPFATARVEMTYRYPDQPAALTHALLDVSVLRDGRSGAIIKNLTTSPDPRLGNLRRRTLSQNETTPPATYYMVVQGVFHAVPVDTPYVITLRAVPSP